mmetsp:Transcript_66783/g.59896  ORF Transcript_66783/g.59896 Transcript_66783/m.59896 type:complete len:494 (-) Transcript_66783:111-1592(-)
MSIKQQKDKQEEKSISGCPKKAESKYAAQNNKRWSSLNNLLFRASNKFAPGPFDHEEENLDILQEEQRVLVVGAGGLGCEILKNLALSGFTDIEVIDLDIIDISNLNRQFLFREKDIGHPKAKIAAEFVMKRVPGCVIKWHQGKIQDKSESFYSKFNIVIAGLDNIEARRWLNSMLCDLVKKDEDGQIDANSIIPFIDGGTEGFSGQCRAFVPRLSACFECSVNLITPPKGFPECTIAVIPRRPEHCVAYAKKMVWAKLKTFTNAKEYEMMPDDTKNEDPPVFDADEIEHMSWVYNRACEWADKHKIQGVTYELTQQVVKNIIPAIASTNAIVSACCVNEAFKMLTWCSFGLNNWFQYGGQHGIYSPAVEFKKNDDCPVCSTPLVQYRMDRNEKFINLYHRIYHDEELKLQNPSISRDTGGTLWPKSKDRRPDFQQNLDKKIVELFDDDELLIVTDKAVLGDKAAKIRMEFVEDAKFVKECDGNCPFHELIKF